MGLMDRAKQAQQAYKIQKALNAIVVEAERLDGKVKVSMNGSFKPQEIKIDESLLSPDKGFELEKALKDALGEAHSKAQNAMAAKAKEMGLGGM